MNLKFPTKADAQARANKMHADLIATNTLYAASAALYDAAHPERGGTARWCFPYQDVDPVTKVPKDAFWRDSVDQRAINVLTAQEKTVLGVVAEATLIIDTEMKSDTLVLAS